MRLLHLAPPSLLQLISTILLSTPLPTFAIPNPHPSEQTGISLDELFARQDTCEGGTPCGYSSQLCCTANSVCYTDPSNQQASCTPAGTTPITTGNADGGYWDYITTTYVETDLKTVTTVMSTYVPGVLPATATPTCNTDLLEQSCGLICCASNQFCYALNSCTALPAGGSSGYITSFATETATPGSPIRPTTSGNVVITETQSPTTTVPFITPVATGANVTITGHESNGGGGLSGGAIAGIVIGVLAALLLLGLLCFYCCLKGLLDGLLACFGLGGRKRRRTEVEEYERHSHHTSRHGGAVGGRTWYGAAKPTTRVEKKSHEGRNILGIAAGLGALWAILGLKRRRENRRKDEKYSEYSYSSDYYTSASSASSDDRRTRDTRYSRR